jgi:hypothetical protein
LLPKHGAPNYWAGYTNPEQAAPAPAPMAAPDAGVAEGNCLDGCCDDCCPVWFGSVAGLVLGRDNPNPFWTSYESGNNANQVMNTEDAKADWNGGAEITFGRWFDCGWLSSGCCDARNGLAVEYFFVTPMTGFASVRGDQFPGGTVSTTIDLQDPTTPVATSRSAARIPPSTSTAPRNSASGARTKCTTLN